MKAATISELKKELQATEPTQLQELCISLIKYKKDNKELLTYLLFESHDNASFILQLKKEIDTQFEEINNANLYLVKKSLRKILRGINKYIKYMGSKEAAAELLIYFSLKLKQSGIPYHKSPLLINLYEQQIKKINKVIESLHEDLQHDFLIELEQLS